MINDIAAFLTISVFLYDCWLIGASKPTISQVYQRKFATWVDILFLGVAFAIIMILPLEEYFRMILAVTIGHVFWPNKETHK